MTTASNPTRIFTVGTLAFAALLTACGGGGGDGGTGPAPVTRASVDKETIQSIQGDAVDGAPGRGYVHVCPGLNDDGRPRNLLIVVRGFAPQDTDREPAAGELDSTCDAQGNGNDHHTLVVRYRNGADLIQRNAGFVRAVIEWAIDRYELTAADRIALQGISMGGVVTRYALQSMEAAGRPHLVDLWLSVDAPQRGAYIPIGMQFLADLYKDRGGAQALAVADTPAARQMLTHHYRQGASTQTWTADHKRLYVDELNGTLGGFPKAAGLRRVGISSGRLGEALQDPKPGQRYVAGRLQVFSGSVPVSYRQENAFCSASVSLNLPIVSTLVLEAFPLGLQANQKSLVARSNVETKVAGYDVDTQVSDLTSYINARVSITGLLGLCETFAATAKAAIVKQAVDAAVAAGEKEAAPYTATYEKSFEAYGDGIQSEGAPGGRSNYIDQLRDALTQAGFSSEAGVTGGGTHMFVSVASALNIATPTGRMDATALQASSPFDQVYVESASNLDHLSSTSGYFAKEVDELFKR
ncbi:MAG: hypothetical protein AB7U92_15610 [Piscinibacter sp.]|uniref:hypothetical protein n=1 Tax=Piscinibacter sp. TaxID=1903157 RepID=UPI003D14F690